MLKLEKGAHSRRQKKKYFKDTPKHRVPAQRESEANSWELVIPYRGDSTAVGRQRQANIEMKRGFGQHHQVQTLILFEHISIMCQRLTHVVKSYVQDMMLSLASASIIRNRTTIREETLLCPGRLLRAISEKSRNNSISQSEPGKNLAKIPDSMSVWLGKKKINENTL